MNDILILFGGLAIIPVYYFIKLQYDILKTKIKNKMETRYYEQGLHTIVFTEIKSHSKHKSFSFKVLGNEQLTDFLHNNTKVHIVKEPGIWYAQRDLFKLLESTNKTTDPKDEYLHQKITWKQLQNFIETLNPEQKTKHIPVCFQDESAARYLLEPFKMETDIYVYDNEPEDSGSLELLKQIKEDEDVIFDISKCELVCKKGTPFLWLE